MEARIRIPRDARSGAIVMVDDEELDIEAAQRGFRKAGLNNDFVSFSDGPPFLEYLEKVRNGEEPFPALVLLDINMPLMSGFDVLSKMRADPKFVEVPVVTMLTSSTHDRDRETAIASGANDYLIKPNNYNDYTAFFAQVLAD